MQLSLNWLKDFVKIPGSISPEELGLRLTMHSVEIESVEKQADKFKNVIVGKILEIKLHPNADKLQVVKVQVGKNVANSKGSLRRSSGEAGVALRDDIFEVVCGAPNIEVGQLVPLAQVGAVLPNGIEIKETEIRGVKSCGMLCAEDELGLGDDHTGILILEKRAKIGQNLGEYLNLKDVIFEVDNKSITHRPDLWSHYGIAREIAAFLNSGFKEYKLNKKLLAGKSETKLDVKVEDFELCSRYIAIAMDGIKIEASPKWMQERLIAAGMRPINNIVDITNYVMLEIGQPLHAFNRNLVDKIIVRRAKESEIMETLDGEKRKLDNEILVIADSSKPIAIAGAMGGANSEINDNTNSIIIESANFNFISIRKTQQKLGLRTESSIRFEKALDPNLCELAIARTVELVKKLCPQAKVASGLCDEKKFELNQGPIKLNLAWLNKRIGQDIEENKVITILEKLGFKVKPLPNLPPSKERENNGEEEKIIKVTVPSWRATRDVFIPEDLLEEVVRIYGFNNLTPSMPRVGMKAPEFNQERILERKIKSFLSEGAGLAEVYNYSFVGEEQLEKLNIEVNHIKLANPITTHQTMLRQSLVPNLVENIKINQARYSNIGLFEMGSIYLNMEGELKKDAKGKGKLPYQEKRLGIIIASDKKEDVFAQVKSVIGYLLTKLDFDVTFVQTEMKPDWVDKNVSAKIVANGKDLGIVARLNNKVVNNLGIKKQAAIAEISARELFDLAAKQGVKKYQEFAKFPPAVRDLAFVVNEKIMYNDIRDEILHFHEYIKTADLFDVYQGKKLGAGKKNLAFHIIYQTDKTLTAEEIDKLQQGLIKKLEEKFEAKIRDF